MLGWHVSVFRQRDDGESPATMESPEGARLAVWQTPWDGLSWFKGLVAASTAIDLGGDGYPIRYTAKAHNLTPRLLAGSPKAD